MMLFVFYLAAAVALVATLLVITRLNAIHALLYLIVSLLAVALMFFTLGAPFVAALEVIIYAGAIMVLFVFAIMMLNLGPQALEQESQWFELRAWVGPGVLAFILLINVVVALVLRDFAPSVGGLVTPQEVGAALFGPYLLAVELAAMLLLAGLVGAFHLGRRVEGEREARESARADSAEAA